MRRRTKILCIIDLNFYPTVFTSIHNLQIWNNTCGTVLIFLFRKFFLFKIIERLLRCKARRNRIRKTKVVYLFH